MTNRRSGRIDSSHARTSSNGPNSGRHSSVSVCPASYTCSMDGACEAPIPPRIRAMSSSPPSMPNRTVAASSPSGPSAGLAHALADLDQRRVGHADQLRHGVDRHPVAPELDPVARSDEPLLVVVEAELIQPPLLVPGEERSLLLVLERVGGTVH